ncbi:MAG: hypothetical protein ABH871_07535 [Pseudomonadota bacterium]
MKNNFWSVLSIPQRRTHLILNIAGIIMVIVASFLQELGLLSAGLLTAGVILWLIGEGGLLRSFIKE